MTCAKDKCIHREYCQRHIGQQEDGCVLYQRDNSPITNEEYLRSCNTEQLADVLLEHFEWGLSINAEFCFTEKYVELNRKHILEWLKQPHTPKE